MSHLARIIELKEEMANADFTVDQQMAVITDAYVVALVRNLLSHQGCKLYVSEEYENQIWSALNMWNKISPVKGGYVVQRVKMVLNNLCSKLMSKCQFEIDFFDDVEGVEFSTEKFPSFEVLVATLIKEFEDYIYHGEHD